MIIVPKLNLRHIKMQKSKVVKNPAVRDTWKITSNLSTHDTLMQILEEIVPLLRIVADMSYGLYMVPK